MSKDSLMDIWERVRDEIRRLRGMNRFRGQEEHLIPRKEVRIPVESRGGETPSRELVIHLSEAESEVYAEELPGGQRWAIADFDMDLEALVGFVVDRARGDVYLHTNSSRADYRKRNEYSKGNEDEKE